MDYITIIQGDDTNFLGDQFLVINFNTDIDLSGFTATFTLGDVTLTYGDLSGKNFEVILSDEITSNLKLGKQYGELKLIDTQQRIRTVTSVIPFLVRKGVNEEIRFVNNSLEVSMNINDTVLNVLIETPGIARAEATRMMSYCNDAKVSAQSYANEAHNTHIQLNQDVDAFYGRMANFDDIVADAYQTCVDNITTINETRDSTINEVETLGNEKIAAATQQANIATQKTQEVSNTYTTAMSDIATARSNSLNDIDNKKDDSISDIEDKRVSSVDSIEDTAELGRYSLTEIANELLYKWNLFDVVKKDHLLTFEETQGLALPGTYVYKTPVAGERYGYPTFYAKCVEEYNESNPYVIKNNIDTVGFLSISNGLVSGFAAGTYFKMNKLFSPNGQTWQIVRKIKTGALGFVQSIFHCESTSPNIALKIYADGTLRLWLSSNGTAWNIAGEVASTLTLKANTDYLVSLAFEDTRYVVKIIEYVDENTSLDNAAEYIVINSSIPIVNGIPFSEGNGNSASEPFAGSIDLKHSYIKIGNDIFWTGTLNGCKHSNGHLFYNINNKYIADEIYQNFSIEKCYGIDFTNERVFLPRKNKRTLVREYHNGNAWYELYSDGWLRQGNIIYATSSSSGYVCPIVYPFATNVWDITVTNATWAAQWSAEAMLRVVAKTQNTFTLQSGANQSNSYYYWFAEGYANIPDDLFEYDYICVGNTIQNVATTNIAETITCENDTIPLFHCEYSTRDLGINYLKSLGQWNNGNLYPTAYQHLVNLLGNDNSVKEVGDATITNFDFVVNQDNLTFRLPIATNQRFLIDKKIATPESNYWYNLYSDGWCEQGGMYVAASDPSYITFPIPFKDTTYSVVSIHVQDTSPSDWALTTSSWNEKTPTYLQVYQGYNGTVQNMPVHWQMEGYVNISPNDYKLCNLYFKVNNYLQNAQLLNISNILSVAQNKADIDLSNVLRLSKTFSNLIMTDVMPDWNAVIGLPLATNNVIANKGWVIMRNTVYNSMLDGYINGRYIYHQYGSYGHWEEYNTLAIMVDVNDVVYLSGGELLFIPCKGVTNA